MKDLIVLVPDKNTQYGLSSLFSRFSGLYDQRFSYDIYVHPNRDPGICKDSAAFLRQYSSLYRFAIVFFDYEGCGQELRGKPSEIANFIRDDISRNGWQERVEVIALIPELEIWLWTDSKFWSSELSWNNYSEVVAFIIDKGLDWDRKRNKPIRPKEAFELLLREKRIPRSSSIYRKIGQEIEFTSCHDSSFLQLCQALQHSVGA